MADATWKRSTADDEQFVARHAEMIQAMLSMTTPTELQMPGVSSLLVYALVECAASLLSACPASDRALVIEHYADTMKKRAEHKGQKRDLWLATRKKGNDDEGTVQ